MIPDRNIEDIRERQAKAGLLQPPAFLHSFGVECFRRQLYLLFFSTGYYRKKNNNKENILRKRGTVDLLILTTDT